MFLSLVYSWICLRIAAYLSLIFLFYIYSWDSPSPDIVLAALLCFALITSIDTSVAFIRSPPKMFKFEE